MEASNCDNLPGNTWEDEIMEDTAKNKWRPGKLISEAVLVKFNSQPATFTNL
jgi:hypothetical protein